MFPRKLLAVFAKKIRILYDFSIAVGIELLKPDINAKLVFSTWFEIDIFFHAQRDKILTRCRTGYRGICNLAIEFTAQGNLYVANLRQLELAINKTDAIRLIPCAIRLGMRMFRLEARIPGKFLEESRVRIVEISERFLQCHGIDFAKPARFLATFEIGQKQIRVFVVKAFVIGFPLVAANCKEVVEHETATAKRSIDKALLRLVRIDAILVALCRFHVVTSFAMSFDSRCIV